MSCISFQQTHTHLCVYTYSLLVRVSYIVYSWSSLSIFFVLILLFLFLITLHFLSSFFRAHRDRHHAASDIVAPAGDITQLLNTFPSVRTYTHQSRIPRFDSPPGKRSYLAIHYIVYIKADDAPSYLLHPTTEYQHTSKKKNSFVVRVAHG